METYNLESAILERLDGISEIVQVSIAEDGSWGELLKDGTPYRFMAFNRSNTNNRLVYTEITEKVCKSLLERQNG